MTLEVRSARVSYQGKDALDITRSGNDRLGVHFAPSETLLRPAIRARDQAKELLREADDLTRAPTGIERLALLSQAERIESDMWRAYEPAYIAEMRASYRADRWAWDELLARERVTIVCFCVIKPGAPQHCHRVILRSRILPALGAKDMGEI